MRWWLVFVTACGRVGFDPLGGGGTMGDGPTGNGDSPANLVCGDNVCSASAGESCAACGGDCNTRAFVCGNSLCDPGEDATSCAADCLSDPPAWQTIENDFFTMLNNARLAGTDCPSSAQNPAPAFTRDTKLDEAARVWAQLSAQTIAATGTWGNACNGASWQDIATDRGLPPSTYGVFALPDITAAQALSILLNDSVRCPNVMSAAYTKAGVGYVNQSGVGNIEYYFY
jgi:hypothetical protein